MEPEGVERKLTAILAADVVGYSRLMEADDEATVRTLKAHREVIDDLIARHRGRIVGTAGDSVLAEFASPVEAVRCAVSIQRNLGKRNAALPEDRRMRFRIGINLGDVIVDGEQIYGDGVNVAARLEGLAEAGGVCISGSVHQQVRKSLSLGYAYAGEQKVKNITEPVPVYRVAIDGAAGLRGSRTTRWRLVASGAVVAVLLAAGGAALWYVEPRPSPPPPGAVPEEGAALALPDKPSIAVLPFVNMSGDAEQEYFSDGMTEDIITDLSKVSGLFVIARNSVFTYKGRAVRPESVSRELGVRYVLEGSVRKVGDRVRITAQLIDATTGFHLWAERYDGDMKDIFALQDEITSKIVSALEVRLTPGERKALGRKTTDNLEAYDHYLRGLEYRRRSTREANSEARYMFERTIDLDPAYAPAYTELGWTYFMEWALLWSQDRLVLVRAFDLAQNAISMDESQASAHTLLSHVYLWKRRHADAIAEAEKAIAVAPNDDDGYSNMAEVLTWAGRPEEAIPFIERAMRLNPQYPVLYLWNLGHAYWLAGRNDEAVAALKRTIVRNPDWMPAHAYLCAIYGELGRHEEARSACAEIKRLNPGITLESVRQRLPYENAATVERFLRGLRNAGMTPATGS